MDMRIIHTQNHLTLFENIIIDNVYKTLDKRLEILKLYEKNTEETKRQINLSSDSLKKRDKKFNHRVGGYFYSN